MVFVCFEIINLFNFPTFAFYNLFRDNKSIILEKIICHHKV